MLHDQIRGFKIQRNPSWRSSVKTGLYYGVWFAPSTLAIAVGLPLAGALDCLFAAVARGFAWVGLTVALIVCGLTGFVTPAVNNQN